MTGRVEEMTGLVLVRHGETSFNVENVFRGRMDVPLNEEGTRQALQLASALDGMPIRAVYSGPLSRTMETARPLAAALGLTPVPESAFDNIRLGEWEGRAKNVVMRECPDLWDCWVKRPEELQIPGGDSIPALRARVAEGIRLLLHRHQGETVAVVTHRSVLKVALAEMLGIPSNYFWKFYFDNASYSLVEYRKSHGYTLTALNRNHHLDRVTVETF